MGGKKEMSAQEMDQAAEIAQLIDRVKTICSQIRLYSEYDLEPERRIGAEELFIPSASAFLASKGISDLPGWKRAVQGYLDSFSKKALEHLAPLGLEEAAGNKYYNELPLGEAKPFAEAFGAHLKSAFESGPYQVCMYDLNDVFAVNFLSEEQAMAFAQKICPATVFVYDAASGFMHEIDAV